MALFAIFKHVLKISIKFILSLNRFKSKNATIKLTQHGIASRHNISNHIIFPFLMLNDVRKRFNKLDPLSMTFVQFNLATNMF
jgi:hypothetical protein